MKLLQTKVVFILLLLSFRQLYGQTPEDPLVDSLVKQLAKSKEDTNKVKLLMDLGNNVGYYDAARALQYAKQGLVLSEKNGYTLGKARTRYLLANTYLDLGNYDSSAIFLAEAEKIFESLGRTDMLGMVYNARGNWYYMQSDMYNASHYFTKATEVFHSLKDTVKEIFPYQNLIASLGEIKNYEKALTLSKKLLELLKQRNDSSQMAHALNHIVVNYVALDKLSEANQYIPGLLAYIKNSLDYNLVADCYNVIGEYYFRMKQYDSAISCYKIALAKSLRSNYQPAQINLSLGTVYLENNELPMAFKYLTKAAALASEARSRDIYFRVCRPLGEYYEKTGDYKNAYKYLQEYTKLNDSILVAETRQYSTQLEAVYENNKKENEILRLQTEQLSKTLAIKKRNNYLYAAGALLLISGIFFALKSRNDQNKRKLQQEKIVSLQKEQQVISLQSMIAGQETERNRVAKDLHDGLGGLFSTVKMYFSSLQHEKPELGDNVLFAKSMEMADTASEELRRIAHNLMPEVLMKLGLVNAVQDLCNNVNIGRQLKISLQVYGMENRLKSDTEIMLYRIVQELLNNIIRHAQATVVIIQFNQLSDRLTITIEDNGRGFNVATTAEKNSAGIGTIKSRVNYLKGQLSIDSKQGVGTTVIMEFLLDGNIYSEDVKTGAA